MGLFFEVDPVSGWQFILVSFLMVSLIQIYFSLIWTFQFSSKNRLQYLTFAISSPSARKGKQTRGERDTHTEQQQQQKMAGPLKDFRVTFHPPRQAAIGS